MSGEAILVNKRKPPTGDLVSKACWAYWLATGKWNREGNACARLRRQNDPPAHAPEVETDPTLMVGTE